MASKTDFQVIIVGAGIAGLSLAVSLAQAGFSIALVERKQPQLDWPVDYLDARISALNAAIVEFFRAQTIWSQLRQDYYSPLRAMQVWDDLGGGEIIFDAADIGAAELGYIVENRELLRVLWQQINTYPNVSVFTGQGAQRLETADDQVSLTLDNHQQLSAAVLVGADGGQSWVRKQAYLPIVEQTYHQDALVAILSTEQPHQRQAYQCFLSTGPIALLPLQDPHRVGLIWSAEKTRAQQLMTLDATAFSMEVSNALHDRLRQLTLLNALTSIPLIMRRAPHYIGSRVALIGDAAHCIHPLAGQGANLGVADAIALAQSLVLALKAKRDLGAQGVLRTYERSRKADNLFMSAMMRVFHETFTSRASPVIQIRSQALQLTQRCQILKKYFMRYAVR